MASCIFREQSLDFICLDLVQKKILNSEELEKLSISELFKSPDRRYIALQKVGVDKEKKPIYLYDTVKIEDGESFFIDFIKNNLVLRSQETGSCLQYYPEYISKILIKTGNILLKTDKDV